MAIVKRRTPKYVQNASFLLSLLPPPFTSEIGEGGYNFQTAFSLCISFWNNFLKYPGSNHPMEIILRLSPSDKCLPLLPFIYKLALPSLSFSYRFCWLPGITSPTAEPNTFQPLQSKGSQVNSHPGQNLIGRGASEAAAHKWKLSSTWYGASLPLCFPCAPGGCTSGKSPISAILKPTVKAMQTFLDSTHATNSTEAAEGRKKGSSPTWGPSWKLRGS